MWIHFWGWKIPISAAFYPFFGHFRSKGPISITSRACERSNDGPEDRKCPKNGPNEAEIPIFQLNNRNQQKPKLFNGTYCFVAFLSDWQKTICKVLYPSLNHYSLPKLKVTSYRKYMRGAKVMTYFSTYLMPVFCKNKPNNPSLIVYTYYIVLILPI